MSQIFNENIETANFLNKLEYANITQIYKKQQTQKGGLKICYYCIFYITNTHTFVVFMIKSTKTLTIHCLDIKWATESDATLKIHCLQCLENGRKI